MRSIQMPGPNGPYDSWCSASATSTILAGDFDYVLIRAGHHLLQPAKTLDGPLLVGGYEHANPARLFFLVLLLVSIIGLKFTAH